MARKCIPGSGIKRYHVLLTSAKKILADDEDETREKEKPNLSYSTSQLIIS